jgi:S-formylglutathione hydrolase
MRLSTLTGVQGLLASCLLALALAGLSFASFGAGAWAQLEEGAYERRNGSIPSQLVPGPVEYAVLLPPGYDEAHGPYPLLIVLHGGGGSRENLMQIAPALNEATQRGIIPAMVAVMPSVTPRSFYMDFRDGSELWETFLMSEFIAHVQSAYAVSASREHTFITGASMGGMGAARLAFRYPDQFAAVAMLFPGIEPVLAWEEVEDRHRFWRSDDLLESIYGSPVDPDYWAANNPANIVIANAERLRRNDMGIYIEAGDEDVFLLHEGTEFLHRVLFDHGVRHEYRFLQWEDHGSNYTRRMLMIFDYFGRWIEQPEMDARMRFLRSRIIPLREDAGIAPDRYVPPPQ